MLRRRHRVQRATRLEILPVEIDRVNLVEIGERMGFTIHHHRIGLPGIPQLVDHIKILLGHVVTLVMLRQPLKPEVLRRPILSRGHDVPPEPTLRNRISRRTQPRQQIRRIKTRRHRRHHTKIGGVTRHLNRQRHRILLRRKDRVLQRPLHGAAIRIGHHHRVLDHHEVETRPLHTLGHIHMEPPVGPLGHIRGSPLRLPIRRREIHEPAEVKLLGHLDPPGSVVR
ncbi:Uncharacterised protein [Mycolicibacterium vanbaalenii]|uniref:Uncharacterized protein n=1 Tax=Mycolicibacterium vanbaalenii TaxID=110539 RepID=A0A5S9R8Y9_MYCVN|nr:Uncharacterised protein [Mycolicibacterium vanbaalenii]